MNVNSDAKRTLRETTFREQIETVLMVEQKFEGRWVIQKFKFGEWSGLWVVPIDVEDPVTEMWGPFGSSTTPPKSNRSLAEHPCRKWQRIKLLNRGAWKAAYWQSTKDTCAVNCRAVQMPKLLRGIHEGRKIRGRASSRTRRIPIG